MASSEHYQRLAQRCREVAVPKGKRQNRANAYLLALAERFEDAARGDYRALAGDNPLGRSVVGAPEHKVG